MGDTNISSELRDLAESDRVIFRLMAILGVKVKTMMGLHFGPPDEIFGIKWRSPLMKRKKNNHFIQRGWLVEWYAFQ